MIRACVLLIVLLASTAVDLRAEDAPPKEAAELEVFVAPTRCVVGEPVLVTLALRYDQRHFAEHAASLFRRPLDLEAQLTAPWLKEVVGAVVEEPRLLVMGSGAPEIWRRVALNGDVGSLKESETLTRGGRTWITLTVTRTLIPTQAGTLTLEAPGLNYAYAPSIEENLLGERTASVSTPTFIQGKATTIIVDEPPTEGRPEAFDGLVATTLSLETRVSSEQVRVGEPFTLTLVVSSDGNLGLVEQPRFEIDGFHVFGAKEEAPSMARPGRRVIEYELEVTQDDVASLPPLELHYYDPAQGYRKAASGSVRLEVQAREGPAPSEDTPRASEEAERDAPRSVPFHLIALAVLGALLLVGAGAALLWRVRPRAQSSEAAAAPAAALQPPAPSRAQTQQALLAALDDTDDARMEAYSRFLAAHLGCGVGSVVGKDLSQRLQRAGASADLAARAAEAMDALVLARYGGAADAGVRLDAPLVDGLAASLTERR